MGERNQESVLRVFKLSGPPRGQRWGSGWSWGQVSLCDPHLSVAMMGRTRLPLQVCVRGQDTERSHIEDLERPLFLSAQVSMSLDAILRSQATRTSAPESPPLSTPSKMISIGHLIHQYSTHVFEQMR